MDLGEQALAKKFCDLNQNKSFVDPYSQVSVKQASSLNYFEEIFHPARTD